uniref:Uncharacterized protein n=1 Tax=Arundo donax TaxID=35708 RepID=A0A0A9F7V9_ARUDO
MPDRYEFLRPAVFLDLLTD